MAGSLGGTGMRALAAVALSGVVLAGCTAPPRSAPFGAQLFSDIEEWEVYPGAVIPVQAYVYDATDDIMLNNVWVEFFAIGAILVPPQAVVGVSNQPDDSGESLTTWCDDYLDDAEAYSDCLNDYYFQATGTTVDIGPTYARIATDDRGVARLYAIPFCAVDPDLGYICGSPFEDQEGLILIDIGVSALDVTLTWTGLDVEEE